jgi:leucyl-tRNA synthetase
VVASREASQDEVKAKFRENEKLFALVEGKTIVKEIYVTGKIFNVVVK